MISSGVRILQQLALIHHGDAVAERIASSMSWVTSTMVVLELPLDAEQVVLRLGADDRVERAERLVHQQHLGRRGQRARHADALLLAARQAPPACGRGTWPGRAGTASSSSSTRGVDLALLPAEQLRHGADVLPHRAMRKQAVALDGVADAAAQLVKAVCRGYRGRRSSPRPLSGSISRLIIRSSVVLPDPEVPTITAISPSSMVIDTSSTTVVPAECLGQVFDLDHRRAPPA